MKKRFVIGALAGVLSVASPFLFVLNYLEPQEKAVTWDAFSGQVELQDRSGWHARKPWVMVSTIDTRPARVCITSAAHAAINCKLVRFVPGRYREFVAVQGFGFYWWANRISFNAGHREQYRGMKDILRGYAFSAQPYPFIEVLEDYTEVK